MTFCRSRLSARSAASVSPSGVALAEPGGRIGADGGIDMTIAREEIFGPVLAVIPYADVEDTIRIANDSAYGLSGSVCCANPDDGLAVARRVRTGTYTVNGFAMEFSAPFGGFKASGLGRELGPEGLEAYLEPKQIN